MECQVIFYSKVFVIDRIHPLAALVVLTVVTIVSYGPIYQAGYIWDDDSYVTENETLRSVEGLVQIWMEPTATPQYYPIVHSSFLAGIPYLGIRAAWVSLC